MLHRKTIVAVSLFVVLCANAYPSRALAQARVDSIGPAIAWQIQPSGEAGLITGYLFTAAGQPLRGARVRVSGLDRWAESNASGWFSFAPRRHGKFELRIEAIGYHAARDSVVVP